MNEKILKDISRGPEAQSQILSGVGKLAEVVGSTMGFRGRTVLIESPYGLPEPTKDGYKVLQSIFLEQPVESMSCEIAKQASQRTVDFAGDGPQPLYSKILTPFGWSTMGEMKEGSIICGTNGTTQTVLGVYPKGEKEILKVKFSDGRIVECCEDHLWQITNENKNKEVTSVKTILDRGLFRIKGKNKNKIQYKNYTPITFVDFHQKEELPIDAYTLGVLLGDGSLSGKDSSTIEISLGYKKEHILDKLIFPEGISFRATRCDAKNYIRVKITGKDKFGKTIKNYLDEIGLLGTLSRTKFIPQSYLFSSLENRKKLLQGLTDTDGYINKKGLIEFSSVSEELCKNFLDLCRGLGMQLNYSCRKNGPTSYKEGTIMYKVVELKGYANGLKIIDIERTGIKTQMQCIKVSNDDSLYITDDYVVTHNTTCTIVLLHAFLKNSIEAVKNGKSPIDVKHEIEKSRDLIIKYLDDISLPINDELIYSVALTSANGEEEIAKIVAEAFIKAGAHGAVSHLRSNTDETYLDFIDGTLLEGGYASDYFITNHADRTCEFERPFVVFSTSMFKTTRMITPFLEVALQEKRPIVIVADWSDSQTFGVRDMVITNFLQHKAPFALVNAPSFGNKRRDFLTDLATKCDTTPITSLSGDDFKGRETEFLGTCEKITIGKMDTIIVPIQNEAIQEEVNGKISELKSNLEVAKSQLEKNYIQDRIAKLAGGVSIIKVGSIIESELGEKIDRVEDAVCAVRSAKEEGVLAGGGVALLNATMNAFGLDKVTYLSVMSPFEKIMENAGKNKLVLENGYPFGYDVKNFKEVNMIEAGIVDSTKAIKHALTNAISASNTLLMTDNVITNKRNNG